MILRRDLRLKNDIIVDNIVKKTKICSISLPEYLLLSVDSAREDTPRSKFIMRLLEKRFAEEIIHERG